MFHQHALYYNTAFQYDPHKYNVDPPIGYKRKLNEVDSSYLRSRTAANLRERKRMQCINEAFEGLRKHIPTLPYEKRLSKVDTLRLAICYINFLTELISSGGTDDGNTDGLLTPNSSRKCNGKIVIYNTTINENKELGFPPLKGHSLSWASDKCDEKLRYVKTTRIWHPEDPKKIKLSTYS